MATASAQWSMEEAMEQPVDFVITWVDGQDPAWRAERARYREGNGEDAAECRYRDWGLLRYWFRGVEKFAPWARRIHFVTWAHLPPWLNTKHPKLHIVRHEDYIPSEYLPTFNSHILEIYLHRIPDLAEQFVYFNDDMYIIRPLGPERFFHKGKPQDILAFQPVIANPSNPLMSHVYLNDALVLCKYFDKRENVRKQPGSYFHLGYPPLYFFYNLLELSFPQYTGFCTVHTPNPFLKQTFQALWEREGELLTGMSGHRFRDERDVTPCLFRSWQKLTGNFHARNTLRNFSYHEIGLNNDRLVRTIQKQKSEIICVNDTWEGGDAKNIQAELQEAFQRILPETSSYER